MAIGFSQIVNTTRVPSSLGEVDPSGALLSQGAEPHHALIYGIRLSTGTAVQGQVVPIVSARDGDAAFGAASHLAEMCFAFKSLNPNCRVSAVAMDEAGGGTAATCTFPLVGTSTALGTLTVRVGAKRASVSLASGSTAAQAATALNTALGSVERLMWTAGVSTGTVTLTCRHKGEVGNYITIAVESIPAGLTCTPTQPSNGATNPTIATLVAALPDQNYGTIVSGLSDTATLSGLEAEADRRWGPYVQKPCQVFAAVKGSHATLISAGDARNSECSHLIGAGNSPTPPWVVAAQVAAQDVVRCESQPNRPRNGMLLPLVEAPPPASQFTFAERNLQLFDGISTLKYSSGGQAMIERVITTRQVNISGLADATYLSVETRRNLAYIMRAYLSLASVYDDFLLAPDGTNVGPGVPVITPKAFAGECVALYAQLEAAGLVYGTDAFKKSIICEIRADNKERLDVQIFPALVGGKVVTALKLSFKF